MDDEEELDPRDAEELGVGWQEFDKEARRELVFRGMGLGGGPIARYGWRQLFPRRRKSGDAPQDRES